MLPNLLGGERLDSLGTDSSSTSSACSFVRPGVPLCFSIQPLAELVLEPQSMRPPRVKDSAPRELGQVFAVLAPKIDGLEVLGSDDDMMTTT